jgi:hypothetical protein
MAAHLFHIGQLVNVERRAWAGINKPGGVGRITCIDAVKDSTTFVSVKYILDGLREERIELKYVHDYQFSGERLRQRSIQLGRCTQCGAFRSDCGSCDINYEKRRISTPVIASLPQKKEKIKLPKSGRSQHHQKRTDPLQHLDEAVLSSSSNSDGASSGSSMDTQELLEEERRHRKRLLQYETFKERQKAFLQGSDDDEESARVVSSRPWSLASPADRQRRQMQKRKRRVLHAGDSPESHHSKGNDSKRTRLAVDEASLSSRSEDRETNNDMSVSSQGSVGSELQPHDGMEVAQSPGDESLDRLFNEDESEGTEDETNQLLEESQFYIQPEGFAEDLPSDIEDLTKDLLYVELGPFFDELAHRLEKEIIPAARKQVLALEKRWKEVSTKEHKRRLIDER